jgi:hypothetical protein
MNHVRSLYLNLLTFMSVLHCNSISLICLVFFFVTGHCVYLFILSFSLFCLCLSSLIGQVLSVCFYLSLSTHLPHQPYFLSFLFLYFSLFSVYTLNRFMQTNAVSASCSKCDHISPRFLFFISFFFFSFSFPFSFLFFIIIFFRPHPLILCRCDEWKWFKIMPPTKSVKNIRHSMLMSHLLTLYGNVKTTLMLLKFSAASFQC